MTVRRLTEVGGPSSRTMRWDGCRLAGHDDTADAPFSATAIAPRLASAVKHGWDRDECKRSKQFVSQNQCTSLQQRTPIVL